jgi:hypothetical protein
MAIDEAVQLGSGRVAQVKSSEGITKVMLQHGGIHPYMRHIRLPVEMTSEELYGLLGKVISIMRQGEDYTIGYFCDGRYKQQTAV